MRNRCFRTHFMLVVLALMSGKCPVAYSRSSGNAETPRMRAIEARVHCGHQQITHGLERRFERLERRIGTLRARALREQRKGKGTNVRLVRALERMQMRMIDARSDLRDLEVASEGSFDRFRIQLEADLDDIQMMVGRYHAE